MAETAYVLCAFTSLACAVMLARGYWRSRARFLLWCAACFVGLALNNSLLFVDKVIFPGDALSFAGLGFVIWRGLAALGGIALLLFGLVWDAE